ncbi:MAG TPA: hypothetical protein VFS24_05650 [Steroidobacteraceae bacterium]|nr:hypothetical protein [Steroidobacteraceae bacterium]
MHRLGLLLCFLLAACATTHSTTPREYLDEQTAATIKVVADPWIFSRERTSSAVDTHDYLNIYAIDVNRMGEHRQYLAVLKAWPENSASSTLELTTQDGTITLAPTSQSARELGIAQPIASTFAYDATWRYFPIDKEVIAKLGRSPDLRAAVTTSDTRVAYTMWRDGSAEMTELAAELQ